MAVQQQQQRRKVPVDRAILIGLAAIWFVISIYPVWMVVAATFSSPSTDITRILFPDDFANGWSKMLYAIKTVDIGIALVDTSIYTAVTIIGMLVVCSLAAYEFNFYSFPGKRLLFSLVMASMMLPLVLYVVPLYRMVFSMGLADTYLGIAIPLMASPLSVFILMQFMEDLPMEFVEAARVDGAGHFRIYFFVILPLMRNGLITATILLFLNVWSSFLWPSLVTAQAVRPLSVVVANLFNPNFYVDARVQFAAMLIAMVPVIVLYAIFQKYVIKGVSMSGVKG
jgi:multiple sugar transport system permease protein